MNKQVIPKPEDDVPKRDIIPLPLYKRIEDLIQEGLTDNQVIAKLSIPKAKWYRWKSRNQQGFAENITNWRRKRLLWEAEQKFAELMESRDEKVKLETAKFIAERLGKEWYSARAEGVIRVQHKVAELTEDEKSRIDNLLGIKMVKQIEVKEE